MTEPQFVRVQHVSVPMPPDGNEMARAFYGGVLGLTEKPVPKTLDESALVWFRVGDGDHEVHVFTDEEGIDRTAAQHLCLQVTDLAAMRERLSHHGVIVDETTPIKNRPRLFIRDPFGNRIELTEIQGAYE